MRLLTLFLPLLLLNACVTRDNPNDVLADNYDELLQYEDNSILLRPLFSSSNSATFSLETVRAESNIGTMHIVFTNSDITIESIEVFESGVNAIFNDNVIDIISLESPMTGSVTVANITVSGISNDDNISFELGDSGSSARSTEDITIEGLTWTVVEETN